MRRVIKEETGSIIILVALGLTLFLGLLGIVVDGGYLYLQRGRLVNAVDAAALAGVQELSMANNAVAEAYNYAAKNNVSAAALTVGVSHGNSRISVEAKRQVDLFFMPMFGFKHVEVKAYAQAERGGISGYMGAAPFGVEWGSFEFGQTINLKNDPHSGGSFQGNFGALALGGTGASNYEKNIKYGYPGMLRIGDNVPTETGNMAGKTKSGIQYLMGLDPLAQFDEVSLKSSRILVVPIVDSLDVKGRKEITILGFASFFLENVETKGSDATVVGRFMRMVVDGEISSSAPDYGLTAYRLVK